VAPVEICVSSVRDAGDSNSLEELFEVSAALVVERRTLASSCVVWMRSSRISREPKTCTDWGGMPDGRKAGGKEDRKKGAAR